MLSNELSRFPVDQVMSQGRDSESIKEESTERISSSLANPFPSSEFPLPAARDTAEGLYASGNAMSKETVRKLSDLTRRPGVSPLAGVKASPSPSTNHHHPFALPGRAFSSLSGGGSALPAVPTSDATPRRAIPMEDDSGDAVPGTSSIKDDLFLSDILFMWLGVQRTLYIIHDENTHRYTLNSKYMFSAAQQECIQVFQSCGVLAHQIDEILHRNTVATSYLQQSLRSALRRQLTQYHCLIASLRQRTDPPLTVGELTVAFNRILPKLWAMHHILMETESVKGGELASKLQQLIHQGSHRLELLLSDIYIEAISPLLHMTVSSITQGEVSDPFNEFFITSNPKVEESSDIYWTSKHSLSTSMLPQSVLHRHVAEDILLITKNICFIKYCCRAKQWRMHPSIVQEAGRASFDTIPRVVQQALEHSNAAVLRLIREEFKVDEVFKMINAFLLVGYGDFFELLIQKVEPILSKLSPSIQVSLVREQVESALVEVAPYAKHLDVDRFSSLHCEVIKDEGKIGWDAFVLTMPLNSPLNNLFDASTMKVYRRLFRMMFKVKVAEVSLKNAWRQSVALDRLIGGLQGVRAEEVRAWREVAADAHLLGLQLNHFVMNLWSYLVSEVSTVAWDLLNKALSRCKSFDDMRVAHNTYLAYLTQRSLLHNDCANIRINIENVLTIVREYRGSQALLRSLLERGCGELLSIKRQYQGLTDEFHRSMSSLLTTLEEQHMQYDYLNFLLLRLNFNRFYHDTDTAGNTEF